VRPTTAHRSLGLAFALFLGVLGAMQVVLVVSAGQGALAGRSAKVLGQDLFGGEGAWRPWALRHGLLPEPGYYHDAEGQRYYLGIGDYFLKDVYRAAWADPALAWRVGTYAAAKERYFMAHGARYLLVVVPDVARVREAQLPGYADGHGERPRFTELVQAAARAQGSDAVFDLLPGLQSAPPQGRLYRYHDHHLNPGGVALALDLVLRRLGVKPPYAHHRAPVPLPADTPELGALAGPERPWPPAEPAAPARLRVFLGGDSYAINYFGPCMVAAVTASTVYGRMNDLADPAAALAWGADTVIELSYEGFLPWIHMKEFPGFSLAQEPPRDAAWEQSLQSPDAPVASAWDWQRGELSWGMGELPREGELLQRPVAPGPAAEVYLKDSGAYSWLRVTGYCATPGAIPRLELSANGQALAIHSWLVRGGRYALEGPLRGVPRGPGGLLRVRLQRPEWPRDAAPQVDGVFLTD
jgi:hypothetical protein